VAVLVPIDDPTDERLADYLRLTDADLRRRGEVFLCEGLLVIRRAIELGTPLRSLLVTPERWEVLRDAVDPLDVPVYVVAQDVMNAVTGFNIHRGAIAAAARPEPRAPAPLLRRARTVAVLEGVNDLENLGAVFRNAAAFGIDAVLLDPTTADPLYRRCVRVSLGHVLAVPHARIDGLDAVRAAGFETVALTPDLAAEPIDTIATGDRMALLLGAEGPGLADATLAAADRRVRIPMAAGVDSLNVATAAAIAFHHRSRAT
jgi:tRNA G18 (ribose-2'-O)-methylase SpoU